MNSCASGSSVAAAGLNNETTQVYRSHPGMPALALAHTGPKPARTGRAAHSRSYLSRFDVGPVAVGRQVIAVEVEKRGAGLCSAQSV